MKSRLSAGLLTVLLVLAMVSMASATLIQQFDADLDGNHTESGFTSFAFDTLYSDGLGYGWDAATTAGRDRGAPESNLLRDLHFDSVDRTFMLDVENGVHEITLYFHDNTYFHDTIRVFAQGSSTASVDIETLEAATTVKKTFSVTVSDELLALTFSDYGGLNQHWIINAIEVVSPAPVPEPTTILLLGGGLIGLGWYGRKRKNS